MVTSSGFTWKMWMKYYQNCVFGDPDCFVFAVTGDVRGGFDCLIGEKMWEQMQDYWGEP